jgi:membrane dipeptidase
LLAAPLLATAGAAPEADLERGRAAIAGRATVDVHSHAGGINGVNRVQTDAPFTPVAAPMRAGGMAVACLAVVSDSPTHKVMPDRRIRPYRDPGPGELYAFGQRAFARLHELARIQGIGIVADAAQLAAARSASPSMVVSAEGADFLEGQPDRVDEAVTKWQLRHLQLVHYRVNELGDIQTEAPVHGGLTETGAAVIRRCNDLGVVVDVAHATLDTVRGAVAVARRPLLLSHTSLATRPGPFSRQITPDHARAVAATGGVIGIWPPASIFPDMAALAGGFARMADVVGVDHVALGSDMMGLVGPSAFPDYDALPALAAALLARGFSPDEVGRLLGGNYVRLFAANGV